MFQKIVDSFCAAEDINLTQASPDISDHRILEPLLNSQFSFILSAKQYIDLS